MMEYSGPHAVPKKKEVSLETILGQLEKLYKLICSASGASVNTDTYNNDMKEIKQLLRSINKTLENIEKAVDDK